MSKIGLVAKCKVNKRSTASGYSCIEHEYLPTIKFDDKPPKKKRGRPKKKV